jgi:hypothetical protein
MTTHQPDRRIPEDPDPRFWLGVFLPTAAAFFAALALVAGWSPQLPAEVAQQWDWSTGQVSTVGPLWLIVLSLALPAAAVLFVLAVFKWSGKLNGWGRRLSVALPAGIACPQHSPRCSVGSSGSRTRRRPRIRGLQWPSLLS